MNDDFFTKQQSLDKQFFYESDQVLLQRLREEMRAEKERGELAKAFGIQDANLLQELVNLGVTAESLTALKLVPMVLVAWADGRIQGEERTAILRAAEEAGVEKGTNGHRLLEQWLSREPSAELEKAWKDYIAAVCQQMTPQGVERLEHEAVEKARQVAEAAGGMLRQGAISRAEADKIAALRAAFPATGT